MATVDVIRPAPSSELLKYIERISGQKLAACSQCGKCTAGCPVAYIMDLTPRQVMRALQLGLEDELLRSSSYWLCLSCETCAVRCPHEIDIPKIMDVLRQRTIAKKSVPAEKEIHIFHRLFLQIIRRWGRIYDAGLAVGHNLWSRHFFANLALLPAMLSRGKLAFFPPKAKKGAAEVKVIFERVAKLKTNSAKSTSPGAEGASLKPTPDRYK